MQSDLHNTTDLEQLTNLSHLLIYIRVKHAATAELSAGLGSAPGTVGPGQTNTESAVDSCSWALEALLCLMSPFQISHADKCKWHLLNVERQFDPCAEQQITAHCCLARNLFEAAQRQLGMRRVSVCDCRLPTHTLIFAFRSWRQCCHTSWMSGHSWSAHHSAGRPCSWCRRQCDSVWGP